MIPSLYLTHIVIYMSHNRDTVCQPLGNITRANIPSIRRGGVRLTDYSLCSYVRLGVSMGWYMHCLISQIKDQDTS